MRWAWMDSEENLAERFKLIPEDIDVIVTHSPPFGAGDALGLDATKYGLRVGMRVGSKALAERMIELGKLGIVVCGHIHEGRGCHMLGGVKVLNVASVDGDYVAYKNRWMVIDW